MSRTRHLQEERLYDYYVAQHCDEPADPPVSEHLADCDLCAARYAEMVELLDGVRAEIEAETDEVFPADRLRAQQLQIAYRLERVGRPAHVLAFPGRSPAHAVPVSRAATRWVAAAAAAGLLIGVGAGVFYDSNDHNSSGGQSASSRQPALAGQRSVEPALAVKPNPADEVFLSELENAAGQPYTRELAPFDALTPRIVEVSSGTR
jgi:anti-sigma factor RsiW